jgi:hypothetical protein
MPKHGPDYPIIPASQPERKVPRAPRPPDVLPIVDGRERPVRADQAARAARTAGATVTVRLTATVPSKLLDGLTDAVVPFTEGAISMEVRADDLEALPLGLRRRAGTSDNGWISLG